MLRNLINSIIITLLFTIGVNAQSQSPISISIEQNNQNPTKSANEQSYKDKYETESLKTKLKEIISQDQNQNTQNKGGQNHHWYDTFLNRTTDWLLTLFNFLLVICTGLLAWYTWGLREVADKQLIEIKASIAVADKAANAARDSADALLAIEKANIFVMIQFKQEGRGINIGDNAAEIILTNQGKTTAVLTNIKARKEIYPNGHPAPDVMDQQMVDIQISSENRIIGSGDIYDKIFPINFFAKDKDVWQALEDGGHNYISQGIIQYEDTFGISRTTYFCWEYNASIKTLEPCSITGHNKRT